MTTTVRTFGSVKPQSHCCGRRIVVGNYKEFKLTALRELSTGEARISARGAGGALDAGWKYEIDAKCPDCDQLLAWNLEGLRDYLESGDIQGEKPPEHPAQKVDRQSPLKEIGAELARWIGYRFPDEEDIQDHLEETAIESNEPGKWCIDPDGEVVRKPDVTGRSFAEEVLNGLQESPNIADVSVNEQTDEWTATIEIGDDTLERYPRLEASSLRMVNEGASGETFAEAVLQIALYAADSGDFVPAPGVEYRISRGGSECA